MNSYKLLYEALKNILKINIFNYDKNVEMFEKDIDQKYLLFQNSHDINEAFLKNFIFLINI